MSVEFLGSVNEREEGAAFYLSEFAGHMDGAYNVTLKFTVGPLRSPARLDLIEAHVRRALPCQEVKRELRGWLFKRHYLEAQLVPMPLAKPEMLMVANAQYDVILDNDVKVAVEPA